MNYRQLSSVLALPLVFACGSSSDGASTSSGGSVSSGGLNSTGGANETLTGGASPLGGASALTGGNTSTGGAAAAGGSITEGGSSSSASSSAITGGKTATGGSAASSSSAATGGKTATGGSATSSSTAATGGNSATGGFAASGGIAASGGASAAAGAGAVSDDGLMGFATKDPAGAVTGGSKVLGSNAVMTCTAATMKALRDCLFRAKKSDKTNTDTRQNPPDWSTWEVHNGVTSGWKNYPLVIYIKGNIDGAVNDSGKSMTQADYEAGDPLCVNGTGSSCQQSVIQAKVERGNISVLGVPGDNGEIPTLNGGWLMFRGQSNVIVRNLRIINAVDYWPSLESCATGVTDKDYCAWNAEPDGMTLDDTSRVWVDHCEFTDGPDFDGTNPDKSKYKMYDGLLDIKNGSDYVTLSYNKFDNHNKAMLIGATDSVETGYRITFVHNFITYVQQRMPRVRNGQVHVLNNYYAGPQKADYTEEYYFSYTIGLGYNSQIYSERNSFDITGATANSLLSANFDAWAQYFTDVGSWLMGQTVDLNAAAAAVLNAQNTSQAGTTPFIGAVTWTPATLYGYLADMSPDAVKARVQASAGVGRVTPDPSL